MDGAKEWKTRAKRQALHRGARYMQVLLVTDGSLVRFHGRDLIEQYLLTQMSIVSSDDLSYCVYRNVVQCHKCLMQYCM